MTNKEFINKFRKISIVNICTKLNVNYFNIMSNRAGYISTKKVANELEKEIKELMKEKENE